MKKLCGWLLALVMLSMPVLGLADSIDKLPETYAELCAMLPDMPTEDPKNFAVRFPTSDNASTLEIYCDKNEWPAASGRLPGAGLKFEYDDDLGAYVLTKKARETYTLCLVTWDLTGYIATANQDENGWIKNIAIYFDTDALVQTFEESDPDKWNWGHVKEDGATNYMMIGVRARKQFDNGVLDVWHYADRTEAIRYDKDGKEVEKKVYPEYSELCKAFKPLGPDEEVE